MEIEYKWKVAVVCCTYNQSQYITDALDGFVMQETDFPFVCCIIDDASTDGEQSVIRRYVEDNFDLKEKGVAFETETDDDTITFSRHKTNANCFFAVFCLKKNLYHNLDKKYGLIAEYENNAKYIALCEGDDYWTSKNKLQVQNDILDLHEELDMCACSASCVSNKGSIIGHISPSDQQVIFNVEETIIGGGGMFSTNSLLFRTELYLRPKDFYQCYRLDYYLQIEGALRGGIYYIPEEMCVYRVNANQSWTMRMSNNPNLYCSHIMKMLTTLDILDKGTDYMYHDSIDKKKKIELFDLFQAGFRGTYFDFAIDKSRLIDRLKMCCYAIKKMLIG